ncbi:transcriptional regulator, TetR family [Selenomonas sp. WCT3]|uniref:TetR/AcrR family transcriptional regulator n=1 Tax=Selenomonas sp. WCT3 TaxID=3158785 RepID=UPI000887263B|nr:transcriptional regulator, TetR family [Selenomonas ruminantium]
MTRVRKDPAERRQELMTIARELFCEKGYEQTMVQDICKKAGVAKGTFFYYFPTKEDVLKAIFEAWMKKFVGEYTHKAEGLDAVQKLRLFLRMSARDNSIEPLVDNLWAEHYKELVMALWQRIVIDGFNPLLQKIIAEGNAAGSMQVLHSEECLDFFWSLTEAIWPDEKKDIVTDESMVIRMEMAASLIEQLFGMEKGSMAHWENAE